MPAIVAGGLVAVPDVSPAGVSRLRWGPEEAPLLAIASWDSKLRLWGFGAGAAAPVAKASFDLPSLGPLLDICWSPDGRTIFGASADASVVGIDVASGLATDLAFHTGPARTVHWSASTSTVISGGWDGYLRFSDPRSRSGAKPIALGSRIHASDLSEDSGTLAVATADLKVHLYDVRSLGSPLRVVPSGLSQQLRSVRFFPGGELYAVTGIEGRCGLRCVSVEAEEELNASGKPKNTFTFKCHRVGAAGDKIYAVHGCDTHPTRADVFATCGADGMFSLWEKEKRVRLREFSLSHAAVHEPITQVAWDATGRLLALVEGYDWAYGQRVGGAAPRVVVCPTSADVLDKQ